LKRNPEKRRERIGKVDGNIENREERYVKTNRGKT